MVELIEQLFPKLRESNYRITSPSDARYNCVAWAVGNTDSWWWPELDPENGYWPEGVARSAAIDAFIAAFATLGYAPCNDPKYEPAFERVAIFVDANGIATHVARQVKDERWTSKLGKLVDIEHALEDLTGGTYGRVASILKRPV